MSVLSRYAEGCSVEVMDLVDVFVERPPVEQPVKPIEIEILYHQENENAPPYRPPFGNRGVGFGNAQKVEEGMREDDERQLDAKVIEEQLPQTIPLHRPSVGFVGLDLVVSTKVRDLIGHEERQIGEKEERLVKKERPDPRDKPLGIGLERILPQTN